MTKQSQIVLEFTRFWSETAARERMLPHSQTSDEEESQKQTHCELRQH
jgi:hypothetical protein